MELREYLDSSPRGTATKLANDLGVSLSYLLQMASGKAPIPIETAVDIERITQSVTRQDMFKDSWHRKWPELASNKNHANRRKGASA